MMRHVLSSAIILAVAVGFGVTIGAYGSASVPQSDGKPGVYTDEQSSRGQALADKMCTSCHGDKLQGNDMALPLHGPDFLTNWGDKTAADLNDKILMTMPADSVGSLTAKQAIDIVAYIFKLNGFPAGSAELPTDAGTLVQIPIRAK